MSTEVARFTTEYIEREDRFRLTGEGEDGAPVVIWLTQRLLQRLLPVLVQWLEKQDEGTPRHELLQYWAQEAARAALEPQAPVLAADPGWVILGVAVDLGFSPEAVVLTFRGEGEERGTLSLTAILLRQWLNILHDAYRAAGWPLAVWPEWVRESASPPHPAGISIH